MSEQEPKDYQLRSSESQVLGERFRHVCDSYGLETGDSELIDSTLVEFSGSIGEIFEKIRALSEKIGDNPRKEDILAALVEISHAYMERNPISPMGRFARRSSLN